MFTLLVLQNGVKIDSFNTTARRSGTTILLKNLHANSTRTTVKSLLNDVAPARRILVPPAGTLALVELADDAAATKVFKALAYRKLGNTVLYVERAPFDVWSGTEGEARPSEPVKNGNEDVKGVSETSPAAESTTLFVTGLPPTLSSGAFKTLFQNLPGFTYAKSTNPKSDSSQDARRKPVGFVGFASSKDAQHAMDVMAGHVVEGHVLQVTISHSVRDGPKEEEKPGLSKSKTTKILLKNLPFEISRKDLMKVVRCVGSCTDFTRLWLTKLRADAARMATLPPCVFRKMAKLGRVALLSCNIRHRQKRL